MRQRWLGLIIDPFDQQRHAAQSLADAGVLVDDVWAKYLSLGGTSDAAGVTAYLCGILLLSDLQRDLIAHAIEDLTRKPPTARDALISDLHAPTHPRAREASSNYTPVNPTSPVINGTQLGRPDHGTSWPVLRVRLAVMFDPHDAEARRQESLRLTGLIPAGREERFDRFTREAKNRFGVVSAVITLVTDSEQIIKSTTGPLGTDLPRETSFCTHTIKEDRPLVVLDATDDDQFNTNSLVTGGPNLRFYAGIPLTGPGNWRIGALCLLDTKPRTFNEQDQRDLHNLADRVQAEILENGPTK